MTSREELNTLVLFRPEVLEGCKVEGKTQGNRNITKTSSSICKRLLQGKEQLHIMCRELGNKLGLQ